MRGLFGIFQDTGLFLYSFVRGTYRSIRDNTGLAAVSVVLAFGIWIVVIEADNPTRTTVVPYDLVVEPINVPPTIAVVEPIGGPDLHLRVRVAVADDEFDSLTAADFRATVDLEGYGVGVYEEVPVTVRALTNRGGLRVESLTQDTVSVTLAQLTSKEVPVMPEITGTLISGYTMSPPELDDTSVTVSGPQSEVDKVTQVTATIDVDGLSDDLNTAVRVDPRDARGTLIPGVKVDPQLVNVKIPIEQQKFTRSMAVSPVITDTPADGYNVVSVSVTPATVTVRGSEAFIAGTSSIPTDPITLDDASEDVVKTVSLDLPTGAEITGGVPVVTVTVRIAPAIGEYNFTIPVTVRNLGGGLAIQGAVPSVTVTLSGPLPDLQALGPGDIIAAANLDGRGAGVQAVPVELSVPDGISVSRVLPPEINLTLVES
jgi:YbbR domain-containing protein